MLKNRLYAAGWGEDSPSPDQLKEFFAQLASGRITKKRLQNFLNGINEDVPNHLTEDEKFAAHLLGLDKVYGYVDVSRVWGVDSIPGFEPTMPYSAKIFQQCAEENAFGADWRLVFLNGWSFNQLERKCGSAQTEYPVSINPVDKWYHREKNQKNSFYYKIVKPGYRLLDFRGRLPDVNLTRQNFEISKLGESYERAEEQVVAQACLSIYMIASQKESLLSDWYHLGKLENLDGVHLSVGSCEGGEIFIQRHTDPVGSNLMAVLSRKAS